MQPPAANQTRQLLPFAIDKVYSWVILFSFVLAQTVISNLALLLHLFCTAKYARPILTEHTEAYTNFEYSFTTQRENRLLLPMLISI